ncbi:sigma-70 family RNA polymerase sigma factor [Catenovulum maritimum]|uniref:sigma-70 family RNA polymerase sigma factor n=1 Tax=Catenovulum maritimum TaxID=1513271 RepID=UPI00069D1525|nr:sigma-70 family RNA polymerase sigma factor [Catenovulum maritimum]
MTSNKNVISKNNTELELNSQLFIELFEADRKRIYAYIYAFVMDKATADDLFQETSMTLWHEFDKFQPNTSFAKWANAIVFNRVRSYRRENTKLSYGLSDELLNELSDTATYDTSSEKRWNALQLCRSKLREIDQKLYDNFYIKNLTANQIADNTGRSIPAIRKSIHNLRKKLFDCIDQKKREGLF